MTRKRIRKLAEEITKLELIHRNPESSKDEKTNAENRIMQITSMINCLPDGLAIMDEIDNIIQNNLNNKE